ASGIQPRASGDSGSLRSTTEIATEAPADATHERSSRPLPLVWLSVRTTDRCGQPSASASCARRSAFVEPVSGRTTSRGATVLATGNRISVILVALLFVIVVLVGPHRAHLVRPPLLPL